MGCSGQKASGKKTAQIDVSKFAAPRKGEITANYNVSGEVGLENAMAFGQKCRLSKDLIKLVVDGKEIDFDLNYKFTSTGNHTIILKVQPDKTIIDLSYVFAVPKEYNSLTSVDFAEFNLEHVKTIEGLFMDCKSLEFVGDLSLWNTNSIENMSYVFSGCKNLRSLKGLSNWDTSNVTNMAHLFEQCDNISKFLPEISPWSLQKVTDISYLFAGCQSIDSLIDIEKWDVSNVNNLNPNKKY